MKLETNELLQYPQSCTFALIHEPSKSVVFYDTVNFYKLLGEILNKLSSDTFDYPEFHKYKHELSFKVIDENQSINIRRQTYASYVESYKQLGYNVLNRKLSLVKYKIRTVFTRFNRVPVVCVVKVNSRNEKSVMGIFRNELESTEFIKSLGDLEIIPDIHADNDLTKEYLNSQVNIRLRL